MMRVILVVTPDFRIKRLGKVRTGCYNPNVSSLSTIEQVMSASMSDQVGNVIVFPVQVAVGRPEPVTRRELRVLPERLHLLSCDLRTIYVQLNTAARRYEQAIYEYLRVISESLPTPEQRAELMKARQTFRELYSDAQMILPEKVLAAAMDVSAGLGEAYGRTKRLERRLQIEPSIGRAADDPEETIETARAYCHGEVYRLIIKLRGLMRQDLGVTGPTDKPD